MSPTFFLNNIFPIVLIVLMSLIINRIATIALTLTGMSRASARFQARSALSGTGFTTSEAEGVANHPVRRRIVMILMLTGNAGIVVTIGSLAATTSRSVANRGQGGLPLWATYALIVLAVGGLLYVMGLRPVDRALSRVIRRGLRRYTDLEVRDYEALLEIHGGYTVSELLVRPNDWLADKTLAELRPNDEGVLVLGVQRDGTYLGAPTGALRIQPGDNVLVYGPSDRVIELDERPAGPEGEERRVAAVEQMRGKTPSAGSGRSRPRRPSSRRDPLEEGL
jgi:hypothetical protein